MIGDLLFFALSYIQSIGLVMIAFVVYLILRRVRETDRNVKKKVALDFIVRFGSEQLLDATKIVGGVDYEAPEASSYVPKNERAMVEYMRSARQGNLKKRTFSSQVLVLNFFEELSLAIESGLADEKMLRAYFSQNALDTFEKLEPFIAQQRHERSNPQLFIAFERMVGEWTFAAVER